MREGGSGDIPHHLVFCDLPIERWGRGSPPPARTKGGGGQRGRGVVNPSPPPSPVSAQIKQAEGPASEGGGHFQPGGGATSRGGANDMGSAGRLRFRLTCSVRCG